MFQAILDQIRSPENYSVKEFRQQICSYMLQNPWDVHSIYEGVAPLTKSYTDFALKIKDGLWGEVTIAAIVGKMWNLAITLLKPRNPPEHLYHNKEPDIVLIFNNVDHYSTTGIFCNSVNFYSPSVGLYHIINYFL